MKFKKSIRILVPCIVLLSLVAALSGILMKEGPGEYQINSVRGQTVKIFGKGLYQHMSADVAVQGIAQDYITLFLGIPLLLLALFLARKNSPRAKFLLAGTLGYFLVTYLFYMCMGMYNHLFLVYVALTATSFFAFALTMLSFQTEQLSASFDPKFPAKLVGGFLLFNAIAVGMMWLSVVIPPLLDGTIYPPSLEHYTTLIVQGMDLALLLPLGFLSGLLLMKKKPFGYLLTPVYMIFLSILMTALTAKIIGMMLVGVSAGPAIVIIPVFNLTAILCSVVILKNITADY